MVSVPDPDSRFLSFIFTTDALRPDFENSAFWTTIGSFPTMITLPARISWAIFIAAPEGADLPVKGLIWKSFDYILSRAALTSPLASSGNAANSLDQPAAWVSSAPDSAVNAPQARSMSSPAGAPFHAWNIRRSSSATGPRGAAT